MKTNKIILGICLAAATVSCSKAIETVEKDSSAAKGTLVTLSASLPEDSKATVSNNGVFRWANGDKIGVWTSNGKFTEFSIDDGFNGKATASFSATLPEGVTVAGPAVYPYHSNDDYDAANQIVTYNLPASYSWVRTNVNATKCAMYAPTPTSGGLSFKHIGAVMRIPFEDMASVATSFRVIISGKRINGAFSLDLKEAQPALVAETVSGDSVTEFTFSAPGSTGTNWYFNLPLPTGTYTSITVKSDKKDGGNYYSRSSLTSNSSRTLERGDIRIMKALSGASKMNDFEDGTTPSNFSTPNFGPMGSAMYVTDNPLKNGINTSDKVFCVNMSNTSTSTSGYVTVDAGNSVYGDGYRNNVVALRYKMLYGNPADASIYYPRVNFNNKGPVHPVRVNGQAFDGTAEKWAQLIKPSEWNYLEFTNSDLVKNGGAFVLRNFVDINHGNTDTGSRIMYFDDLCYVK